MALQHHLTGVQCRHVGAKATRPGPLLRASPATPSPTIRRPTSSGPASRRPHQARWRPWAWTFHAGPAPHQGAGHATRVASASGQRSEAARGGRWRRARRGAGGQRFACPHTHPVLATSDRRSYPAIPPRRRGTQPRSPATTRSRRPPRPATPRRPCRLGRWSWTGCTCAGGSGTPSWPERDGASRCAPPPGACACRRSGVRAAQQVAGERHRASPVLSDQEDLELLAE
jgi:hypothetical protein